MTKFDLSRRFILGYRRLPSSHFLPPTCKFATLIYQILGSEMSVRAPPLLSPYVFVLLPTAY